MAERIGKTRVYISQVENGRGTTTESLIAWATELGLSLVLVPTGGETPPADETNGAVRVTDEAELADVLRLAREAAGISRKEMAGKMGVTLSAITKVELGYRATTTRILVSWLNECGARLLVEREALPVGRLPSDPPFTPPDPLMLRLGAMLPVMGRSEREMIDQQLSFIEKVVGKL